MKTNDVLNEGPNDPHIFKAIFLAGGPGSGKSYVANKLFAGTGLKMINSDIIYEYVMKKRNMPLDPETIFSPAGQATREYAKGISIRNEKSHLDGRLGLILDGTGKDLEKYRRTKKMLEELGYDCTMVFVNTSLEVAQQRNLQRERQIAPEQVEKMWRNVQENMMQFQQLFGVGHFYIVDSTNGVDNNPNFAQMRKSIDRVINAPVRNRNATAWIAAQKNKGQVTEADEAPRPLTQSDLNKLEFYADKLFKSIGIDINFTRHFLDRVNDERNQKQITLPELGLLFRDEFKRWGKRIAAMGPDAQAVMKDMRSDVNVPFALNWDRNAGELDLVAKTVMRKRAFTSPDPILAVEGVEAENMDDVEIIVAKMRKAGWSIYASKANLRALGDYVFEFERGRGDHLVTFTISGTFGRWELYKDGPTHSGRGEMFDEFQSAIRSALTVSESAKQKPAPGAQVKGHEPAKKSKADEHPFAGRLVGEAALGSITVAEDGINTVPVTKDYMGYYWGEKPESHVKPIGKIGILTIAVDDSQAKGTAPEKEIVVLDEKNRIQGKILLYKSRSKKEPWRIQGSALSHKLQGKGLMPKIYAFIVNNGVFLQSDYQQSPGGAGIWAKLADDPTVTVYGARKLGGKWEYTNVEAQGRRVAGNFNIYQDEETEELEEINRELEGLGNLVFKLTNKLKTLTKPKFRAQYEEDLKGLNDRIMRLNAEKEEVKKRGKDADRAYIYLLAVPAKEAVTESVSGKMNIANQAATRGLHTYKDGDGMNNDYTQYRLSMAVAMADGKTPFTMDKTSWIGKKKSTHPYTREESAMLKQAYAAIGAAYDDLNGDDMESEESEGTNKVSPVAPPKKNRYGV